MEKLTPVEVVRVTYCCDYLGCNGMLVATGGCILTSPPKYIHYCNKCGSKMIFNIKYPFEQYREILT